MENYKFAYWNRFDINFPLCVLQSDPKETVKHDHDFYELVFFHSGHAIHNIFNIDDEKYSYGVYQGDCFTILPEERHSYENGKDVLFYNILFSKEIFENKLDVLRHMPGWSAFFAEKCRDFRYKLHLNTNERETMLVHISRLINELKRKEDGYRIAAQAIFMEIILLLLRKKHLYKMVEPSRGKVISRIPEAIELMEKYPKNRFTVEFLARQAGMCPTSFSVNFKKYTGQSPMNYLLSIRLEKAAQLLLSSSKSLSEIAEECGFYDCNYLIKNFRKRYAVTPGKFRISMK